MGAMAEHIRDRSVLGLDLPGLPELDRPAECVTTSEPEEDTFRTISCHLSGFEQLQQRAIPHASWRMRFRYAVVVVLTTVDDIGVVGTAVISSITPLPFDASNGTFCFAQRHRGQQSNFNDVIGFAT